MVDLALRTLTDGLSEVFETALAIEPPAGLPDRWRQLLVRHELPSDPDDGEDRYERAVRFGLVRGAVPDEVRHCVGVLLARFVAAEQARGRDVTAAARDLAEEAEESYLGYATYRPPSRFADAVRTRDAAGDGRGWARPAVGYVLRCPRCGGPRFDEATACVLCAARIT